MADKKQTKKKVKHYKGIFVTICLCSLVFGMISFATAKKISDSTLEFNAQTIKIPSYEEITYENKSSENTQNSEKSQKSVQASSNVHEISDVNDVKVNADTNYKTEKVLTLTAPCEGVLLKRFSVDKPIKSRTMGDFRTHDGIDIKADCGTTISASADGTIENVYFDSFLGTTVIISHNESVKTQYSNIAGEGMVKKGETVKKGDAIGCVGDTAIGEFLDEPHLHFSVIVDGNKVNPEEYISVKQQVN